MSDVPEKILQAKHTRPTAMRLLVLDYFLKQHAAITLNDLEAELGPSDRVTLYRTLKTFEEKGIIHRVDDGTGAAKYALCPDKCDAHHHEDLHAHFYCVRCHETVCLSDVEIPRLAVPGEFTVQEIQVIAKGTCGRCAA